MPRLVISSAKLRCSEGLAPGTLTVVPAGASSDESAAATVMDNAAMSNIAPFGMCKAMSNPQVAAATAAAMGSLTPQPCVPVVTAPWSPGAQQVTLREQKALTEDSSCQCAWSGRIEVTDPGCDVEVK